MTKNDYRCTQKSVEEVSGRWRRLPHDDLLISLWRYVGFSDEEIAAHLGKSLSEVRTAIRRAKSGIQGG